MKNLILVLFLLTHSIIFSQVVTVNVSEIGIFSDIGNKNYRIVLSNPKFKDTELVTSTYILDFNELTVTFFTNGNKSIKGIDNLTKISPSEYLIKLNDNADDGSGRTVPVTIILNTTSKNNNLIVTWYNVDGDYTVVQTSLNSHLFIVK